MSNVFKKEVKLPIVISFTHTVNKSHKYTGYPCIIAECQALNFEVVQIGWGYDMLGAIVSNLINHNFTQYAIEAAFAFNELRGGHNPVRYIPGLECFRVDLCTCDIVKFFDSCGLTCELLYKNEKISRAIINNKTPTTETETETETEASKKMSTTTPVKKFVLKFDFNDSKFSATCDNAEFERSLLCDELSQEYAKNELIKQFIKSQNYNENTNRKIWFYDMKQNTNNATIYCAPIIDFKPHACDFETMQAALTRAKISASFFDSQIEKHLESVGIETTRANVRVYRESYISQISKLLLEEILSKRTIVHVVRWFDKINGDSYSSVSVFDGIYQINIPMCYGYGSAENLGIHALKLDVPSTMYPGEYLENLGVTFVDLGYKPKREMFQAAFHI